MPTEEEILDALRPVEDPELGLSIVDLGLIYECKVTPAGDGQNHVDIKMTLTAPGCGMGAAIAMDAKSKVENVPGIKSVNVDLVWDPPWNPGMMSDSAKQKLGLI